LIFLLKDLARFEVHKYLPSFPHWLPEDNYKERMRVTY